MHRSTVEREKKLQFQMLHSKAILTGRVYIILSSSRVIPQRKDCKLIPCFCLSVRFNDIWMHIYAYILNGKYKERGGREMESESECERERERERVWAYMVPLSRNVLYAKYQPHSNSIRASLYPFFLQLDRKGIALAAGMHFCLRHTCSKTRHLEPALLREQGEGWYGS